MDNINVETPKPSTKFPRINRLFKKATKSSQPVRAVEDTSESAQIALATAQRVDIPAKITASIK
jgi:hypothetical protein